MKTSPFLSLTGATENRRLHPKDVKLPQLVRAAGFYPDVSTGLLTTPIPSYSFPAADTIPSAPARTNLGFDASDVFTIAAAGLGYATDGATITGGGGSDAAVVLTVSGTGAILGIAITNPGVGYTSAPTVNLTGGGGGSITVKNWSLASYAGFIQLGGYVVLLKAENTSRKIRWCAPGRPTVWDDTEQDGDIWVQTGAGYTTLKGSGDLEQGLVLGSLGIIFDATGIGVLAQTGDLEAPWTYAKTLQSTTAESNVREVDGLGYFLGYDGRVYSTSGYALNPFTGAFDLDKITEITWPPASAISFALNTATQNWVAYSSPTYCYIAKETGCYTTSAATKYFTTGVLQIEPEDQRMHIQKVRLHSTVTGAHGGANTLVVSCKGLHDTTWHDSAAVNIGTASTAGSYETTVEVNYNCKQPQLKFTFTTQSGATLRPEGFVVIYDTGGLR